MIITPEELAQHSKNVSFLLLGAKNVTVRIADCLILWKKSDKILFHTGYRLCGTERDIHNVIESFGLPIDLRESILATCISKQNYNNKMAAAYREEWKLYEEYLSEYLDIITSEDKVEDIKQTSEKQQKIDKNQNNLQFHDITGDVDIFDFKKYTEDYKLFSEYFTGLELYLRLAIWISYKYVRLKTLEERKALTIDLNYTRFNNESEKITLAKRDNKKEWLENITDVFEGEQILFSWFKHFKPENLVNVHKLHEKWQYHLEHFFNKLYKHFVDKEHSYQELWF